MIFFYRYSDVYSHQASEVPFVGNSNTLLFRIQTGTNAVQKLKQIEQFLLQLNLLEKVYFDLFLLRDVEC